MGRQNETRHVRVELTVQDHKTLRVAAALRDQTMSAFACEAVMSAASNVARKLTAATTGDTARQRSKAAK